MKLNNLKALESFREIMAAGSVTGAAQVLGMSQPAVSRLLAQLEGDLGFRVFDRVKGRLVPTAHALVLYEEVDMAFHGLERVRALAQDIVSINAGHLRVVAPPTFAEGPLVPVIASFMRAHPKIQVAMASRTRPTTMDMVATRAADCGIGKLPIDHADIRVRPLLSTETICVLPRRHPLLARKTIRPTDLAGEPLIMIGRAGIARIQLREAFRAANITPNVRLETNNVGLACALTGEGIGIAIVNELLARNSRWMGVEMRPFRPRIINQYGFMTSARVRETAVTEAFYQHYLTQLKRRPAAGR